MNSFKIPFKNIVISIVNLNAILVLLFENPSNQRLSIYFDKLRRRRSDFLKQKGESIKIIRMLPLYFLVLTDGLSAAALVDMRNITVIKYELVSPEFSGPISDDRPARWGRSCCCRSCSRRGCSPPSGPRTCT